MIRHRAGVVLLLAGSLLAQNASGPAPAETLWEPLKFLFGAWGGKTQGGNAGADSVGAWSFQTELKGHVLARHSSSSECAGPAGFNCEHSDLLYVYPNLPGPSYKAVYFDNEGHVIYYDVTTPAPGTAIFLSSASLPGPQYRLTYERKASTMYGKFQMRMPGQTAFRSYLEWSGEKKN